MPARRSPAAVTVRERSHEALDGVQELFEREYRGQRAQPRGDGAAGAAGEEATGLFHTSPTKRSGLQAARDLGIRSVDFASASAAGGGGGWQASNGGGGGGGSGTPVALFEDPAYARLMTNILSTSHLTRPSIEVNGFGAVHEEGYGIAYNIHGGHVRAAVSTYLGTGAPFHAAMVRALGYVGALLARLAEEKKKQQQDR